MPSPTLETRTYVGQTGTAALDGYCGFVIGRQYELRYEVKGDQVRITLAYGSEGAGSLVVRVE